ncbi:adenosine deaminase [Frankia sp. CNm7]|uniref:Adenosine deaminase n=1 Tax=Frankia nepalensis TaxID=1836974 RepID=A0A937REC9_9ACTN|nr:adenosine deaminase [Frankia nepalensis]MBL7495517.1 adenosine deaminase [Frankia nepalensis]MBL7509798.1 adenosine deaminase [Frankia nepalensis]MBL7518611.1 adenosine deaminase [Frankia nepalensis]MBL7630621.1 adenosine deaminase [Frankia nepalensis]
MGQGTTTGTTGMEPLDLATALDLLPKVELHCHVEGTMRPGTVIELAHRGGLALPTENLDELYSYGSLDEFLSIFWLVQSTLAGRDDWARLGYESVLDAAAHGRVYAEMFFTPARHLAGGQRLGDVVAGLAEGIAAAEAQTGSKAMLIADIDRAFGPAAGLDMVTELGELRRAGAPGIERVLGVGMDSTELGVDPVSFTEAYRAAAAAGFRLTGHQGENSPPSAIAAVVDVLGAERVDHGLSLVDDPELVRRFAAERIPLTVCPNSNIRIANAFPALADHPYPAMRAAGLLATVNTDDPAMTDLDLGYEYTSVAEAFGYTFDDMVTIALDGVEATWLDPDAKRALRTRVTAEAAALAARLAPS